MSRGPIGARAARWGLMIAVPAMMAFCCSLDAKSNPSRAQLRHLLGSPIRDQQYVCRTQQSSLYLIVAILNVLKAQQLHLPSRCERRIPSQNQVSRSINLRPPTSSTRTHRALVLAPSYPLIRLQTRALEDALPSTRAVPANWLRPRSLASIAALPVVLVLLVAVLVEDVLFGHS